MYLDQSAINNHINQSNRKNNNKLTIHGNGYTIAMLNQISFHKY
jgi:hypothetical protein